MDSLNENSLRSVIVDKQFNIGALSLNNQNSVNLEIKDSLAISTDGQESALLSKNQIMKQANISNVKNEAKPWDIPNIDIKKLTGADKLHYQGFTGKGRTIVVMDSGFDHPEVPLAAWKDVAVGDDKAVDPFGHGTYVAGFAHEMAPDANLIAIRVLDGEGIGRSSDTIKGLQWILENKDKYGIDVVNLSVNRQLGDWRLDKAINKVVEAGILFVVSSGNSGPAKGSVNKPGDLPSVITVGSSFKDEKVSRFSSRGPTKDNIEKPDVLAPGEFVVSWAVPGSKFDVPARKIDSYRQMEPSQIRNLLKEREDLIESYKLPADILSRKDKEVEELFKTHLPGFFKPTEGTMGGFGTSPATPQIAGIIACLKQAFPQATAQQIKEALVNTGKTIGDGNERGSGFVQADKALEYLRNFVG